MNKAVWQNKSKTVSITFDYETPADLVKQIYVLNKTEDMLSITTDADLFEAVSSLNQDDVMRAEPCGKCKSTNISMRMRVDKEDNKYYEKVCECYAKLSFGAHKTPKGSLFGKRFTEKDGTNVRKPDNGWMKWNGITKCDE